MVRTLNPFVATISNDQEQTDDLLKELQENRRTMKHLQTQSTNSDAQNAQQQVDIRALRHEQQGMKAYKTKPDHLSFSMSELETKVSMRLELEKKIKLNGMHNKVDKQMTHTGIIKREHNFHFAQMKNRKLISSSATHQFS